jgi:hypothetical protein
VAEVVLALLWREVVDESANSAPEVIDGSFCGLSQSRLELGEGQLDMLSRVGVCAALLFCFS